MSRLFAVLVPVIISCAAPHTYRPDVTQEELDNEMIVQMEDAFRMTMDREARLDSIVETIVWKNAPLCGNKVRKRYGFYYIDTSTIRKRELSRIHKKLLLRYLDLDKALPFPTITGIVPRSPADSSGLIAGDVIMSVGENKIKEAKRDGRVLYRLRGIVKGSKDGDDKKGDSNFLYLLEESYKSTAPVQMSSRNTCDYDATVVDDATVNAWTDGNHLYFASGMMDFASDEDLALVVSHELAHCTENHIPKKRGNILTGLLLGTIAQKIATSQGVPWYGPQLDKEAVEIMSSLYSQEFEEEADYVGLYIMARAGYSTNGISDFWRRMAKSNPIRSNRFDGTHPPTAKRYILLIKTHKEIEQKKQRGDDLIPEKNNKPVNRPARNRNAIHTLNSR